MKGHLAANMHNSRVRFLSPDEEFDDFAFEDEPVDIESEMSEYRLGSGDEDDETESLFVSPVESARIVPLHVIGTVQTEIITLKQIRTAPQGAATKSAPPKIAVKPTVAKENPTAKKAQPSKKLQAFATGKEASRPAATQGAANKSERKIGKKTGMKNATKKAVKQVAKKAAVKAPSKTVAKKAAVVVKKTAAPKAPVKKAPAQKAPVKQTAKKVAKKK